MRNFGPSHSDLYDRELRDLVKRQVDLEDNIDDDSHPEYTIEERAAVRSIKASLKYNGEFYEAGILWKPGEPQVMNNIQQAEKRLKRLLESQKMQGSRVQCALVMAKSRVAPISSTSIPRLELLAAESGSALGKHVAEALEIEKKDCHF